MFTGIVSEVGKVREIRYGSDRGALTVVTERLAGEVGPGDSVAVNGACLTVTSITGKAVAFDVMTETLRKTTLGGLARGACVNLEGALRVGDRLSGHFVMGHVDGVGEVVRRVDEPGQVTVRIRAPESVSGLLVEKGSVTVDGVSLTTWDVRTPEFSVGLVPYTLRATTLTEVRRGSMVNLEADIMGRWIARLLPGSRGGGIDLDRLRDAGWDA